LGTTNSLVAAWIDGASTVIPNALGERLTPSCVSVDSNGELIVGRAARDRLLTHPDRSAAVFKRAMGTDREYVLGGKSFRPEELSALVLQSLKRDAEAFLHESVTRAVITVPAYFNDVQRKATRTAGQLAGLTVERLLNEPTAAALAYGLHRGPSDSRFLVFDLGGGTFDVSILEWFDGVMEVRASTGDAFLGGEDFVEVLMNAFLVERADALGLGGEKPNPALLGVLRESAERAKRRLSERESASLGVPQNGVAIEWEVSEERFAELSRPLLERISLPVGRAIRDARIAVEQLDEVVMVGGATRMPLVRKLVARLFGRFPAMHVNPDEAIGVGAAVQAGLVAQDAALDEVVLTDVAPHTLGVEVGKDIGGNSEPGYFAPIIERNTLIPASRVQNFSPMKDFQKAVDFEVYQGEGRLVKDNVRIGKLEVPLPGKTVAESTINLRFTYDVSGILEVEASLLNGSQTHRVVIQNNQGLLSPEQITARLKAIEALKVLPRDRAEVRAVLARGERLFAERLGDEREWIDKLLRDFEAVLAGQDPAEIEQACKQLVKVLDQVEGQPYL
jgi:molecular chaperone HscC